MQIVIDIPEDAHGRIVRPDRIFTDDDINAVVWAVYNGIELPKGHGRLKDVDQILDKLLYMGYMDEQKSEIEDVIELLPTLIEANKESNDADSD